MTGLEYNNFCKLDDKRYILEQNKEFLTWYKSKVNEGFSSYLDLSTMQKLIDDITLFFEFIYPDNWFDDTRHQISASENFNNCEKIAKMCDINQLKYRLHHDQVQFLECNYFRCCSFKKERKNYNDVGNVLIFVSDDGLVSQYELSYLKDFNYLKNIDGIKTVEDLLLKFQSTDTDVNYQELEKFIKFHKYHIILRDKLLKLIPFKLLYSNNTLPEYGYKRVEYFIEMFEALYPIDFNKEELDEIMSRDYSKIDVKHKTKRLFP